MVILVMMVLVILVVMMVWVILVVKIVLVILVVMMVTAPNPIWCPSVFCPDNEGHLEFSSGGAGACYSL